MKKILFLIVLAVTTMTAQAQTKIAGGGTMQPLYMYGIATSFNDSIAQITDIMVVDSCSLTKKKLLIGRDAYSRQLSDYFVKSGMPDRLCTVFFFTTKAKAEKAYAALCKRYDGSMPKQPRYNFSVIPVSEFRFSPLDSDYTGVVVMEKKQKR